MNNQPSEKKYVLRAISILKALDNERSQGQLDDEGKAYVREAEDILASLTGRIVATYFMEWGRNGQIHFDPRGAKDIQPNLKNEAVTSNGKIRFVRRN